MASPKLSAEKDEAMGVFSVPITVRNWQNRFLPAEEQGEEVACDALVDSGAAELALPVEHVERLRLEQVGTVQAVTSDGARHEYRVFGIAEVEVQGRVCQVRVIELPHGARPLLGAVPLEEMDWHISPSQKKLVPNLQSPDAPLIPLCSIVTGGTQAQRALRKEPVDFRTELTKLLTGEGAAVGYGVDWIDGVNAAPAGRHALHCMNEHANDDEAKPFDIRARRLCRLYRDASPAQRTIMRTLLTREFRANLLHFAWRKAVQTLRRGSMDAFRLGLRALSLEDRRQEDSRMTLTFLAALCHAASKSGLDAAEQVRAVAEMSSQETAELFLGFLRRDASQKRVEAFGFREGLCDGRATLESHTD